MSLIAIFAATAPATDSAAPTAPVVRQTAPTLTLVETRGDYTIAYIQSSRELTAEAVQPPTAMRTLLTLTEIHGRYREQREATASGKVTFSHLPYGDYTLETAAFAADGRPVELTTATGIGIGTVIAALGDSITEGFWSPGIMHPTLHIRAADFPPEMVSRDRRNFPTYAPSTAEHKPDINCFKSWMPELNDALSERFQRPFFIANEGLGGHTAGMYLDVLRHDRLLQQRLRQLRPDYYLIHLGVNDERYEVPAAQFESDLNAIIDILIKEYQAKPEAILIAFPSYDRHPNAARFYPGYRAAIDRIVKTRGVCQGPDFNAAYAENTTKYYGADPVHPNPGPGMRKMAELWTEAVAAAIVRNESGNTGGK